MNNKKPKTTPKEPLTVDYLTELAQQGNELAQGALAQFYASGDSTPEERTETVDLYRRAAQQGDAGAQFFLGAMLMHDFGRNVPRNPAAAAEGLRRAATEAAGWYRRAAKQGHTDAQYHLGLLHASGIGVDRDPVEAHAWMAVARILGSARAKEHLTRWEWDMSPEQIASAKNLAHEWIEKLIQKEEHGIRQSGQ
jgi:uncharacterized protein